MKVGTQDMKRRKISPKECALMAVVIIFGIVVKVSDPSA